MRLRGIQFIYDNQGKKISAVVDLRRYEKEFAVFLQELSQKRSSGRTSTNPVVGDTTNVVGSGGNNSGSTVNARKLKIDALISDLNLEHVEIVRKIKDIVPEYLSNNSEFEKLDQPKVKVKTLKIS